MKAGANASSTATASGAMLLEFCDQAEGIICATTRYDWVTNYATLNANFKTILDSCASSKAAMFVMNYDLSGYTSRAEAQTMLNILYDDYNANLTLLRNEAEVRRAIGATP